MSYKYNKYKTKYIIGKTLQTAGASLSKGAPDKISCPEDRPHYCEPPSKAMGLCVMRPSDCDRIVHTYPTQIINNTSESGIGEDFGYTETNLGNNCYEGSVPIYESTPTDQLPTKLPQKFKIITWNIWGLIKKSPTIGGVKNLGGSFVDIRMQEIARILVESNADIICCQEVSGEALHYLYGENNEMSRQLRDMYPYCSEPELPTSFLLNESRGHDVEVMLFCKYRPIRYTVYRLTGNLHFTNSMLIAEFPNLIVSSVYLQPGCKFSPGQSKKWIQYARCRRQQLERVGDTLRLIIRRYGQKPMVLTGDFNFHLDGLTQDWPEKLALDPDQSVGQLGLVDVWRREYPDQREAPGYTEDTDVNEMRWNSKFKTKLFRYDGIFASPELISSGVTMIGTYGFLLSEIQTRAYEDSMRKLDPSLRKARYGIDGRLNWFPSDHFGVVVNLQFH